MSEINLGEIILLIAALGYVSNFLNWRYLNYGVIRLLYYIGAVVHETSHAILCLLTGARIEKFTIFSNQPQVVHQKSKLPLLGEPLISFAPIAGGLLFLFLVNHYLLGNHFAASVLQFSNWHDWRSMLLAPLKLIAQINGLQWQSWVMILLFFNVGAMLGPSPRDLKNVWLALIVLFFVPVFWATRPLLAMGFVALGLIAVNILLQVLVIVVINLAAWIIQSF
jgi:hypothetical protein